MTTNAISNENRFVSTHIKAILAENELAEHSVVNSKLTTAADGKNDQAKLTDLFATSRKNISFNVKNIFRNKELDKYSVIKDYLITAEDSKQKGKLFTTLNTLMKQTLFKAYDENAVINFRLISQQKLNYSL